MMVRNHRDMAAAKAFFESAKMVTGITTDRVTTDGHDNYAGAIRTKRWVRALGIAPTSISISEWRKIIAASKAATVPGEGSNAPGRLADAVAPR
jgi:hypothetical protein